MKHLLSLLAALVIITFPTVALPETLPAGQYLCTLKDASGRGYIPPDLLLIISRNGAIEAYDGIIHHYFGKPIAAEIITDNEVRTTVGWTIDNMKDNAGNYATMDFRLTVMKSDLAASMLANPLQFSNPMRGDGACARR